MVIDVTQTLKQYDGSAMMDTDAQGNSIEATVRAALVGALIAPNQKDKAMQKFQKDELARKLFSAEKEVSCTSEELVMMKECVGEAYPSPVVVGQLWRLLDGK